MEGCPAKLQRRFRRISPVMLGKPLLEASQTFGALPGILFTPNVKTGKGPSS